MISKTCPFALLLAALTGVGCGSASDVSSGQGAGISGEAGWAGAAGQDDETNQGGDEQSGGGGGQSGDTAGEAGTSGIGEGGSAAIAGDSGAAGESEPAAGGTSRGGNSGRGGNGWGGRSSGGTAGESASGSPGQGGANEDAGGSAGEGPGGSQPGGSDAGGAAGETEAGGSESDGGTAERGGAASGGETPQAGSAGSLSGAAGTSAGGTEAVGGESVVAGAGSGGECATPYYRDQDGDGWGEEPASCEPAEGWVALGGDCHDDNPDVNPGQTASFEEAYLTPSELYSFDYDCDGEEVAAGSTHLSEDGLCTEPSGGGSCEGDGYLPVQEPRQGEQVNPYCGSTIYLMCSRVGGECSGIEDTRNAVRCR